MIHLPISSSSEYTSPYIITILQLCSHKINSSSFPPIYTTRLFSDNKTPFILPSSIDTATSPTALHVSLYTDSNPSPMIVPIIIQWSMITNNYITDNILFWDTITDIQAPTLRLICSNINGLELFAYKTPLEYLCDYKYKNNFDIVCMSEINFHWKTLDVSIFYIVSLGPSGNGFIYRHQKLKLPCQKLPSNQED